MRFFYKGKRLVTTIVIVTMLGLVTVSFAAEDGTTVSVQQLFAAGSASFSAAVDKAAIRAKQSAFDEAFDDASETQIRGMDEEYINRRVKVEVTPMLAQRELDAAKMDETANLRQRAADVALALDQVMLESNRLAVLEKKLAFEKERLAIAQAKHNAGTLSDIDFADAGYALKAAELEVATQEARVSEEELNLKLVSEVDLAAVPDYGVLSAPVLLETVFASDVTAETLLPLAMANDSDMYIKGGIATAAEMTLKFAEQFYKPGAVVYDDYALELETAKRDASDAERSLSAAVTNTLSEWSVAASKRLLATEYVKLMQKELDTANNRLKAGVASRVDILSAESALLDARMSEWQAVVACNQAEIALRVLVGEDISVPGADILIPGTDAPEPGSDAPESGTDASNPGTD